MSSWKGSEEQPPPYDQATTIDIDNGTAPLLRETFSGSIFGTSTIVKFELAVGSHPSKDLDRINGCDTYFDKAYDYSFVIRDFLECVQANGNVANSCDDLHTTLTDVRGSEIFQFRKRAYDYIEPPARPPSAVQNFLNIIFYKKRANTNHKVEVLSNGQLIGFIVYADKESPENSLKVYIGSGNSELVVKCASKGEFVIFRDHSSSAPLCNIKADACEFSGKIVFHPETGVTSDEQRLCTAAALAYKTCWTKQGIIESREIAIQILFWMTFAFCATMIISISIIQLAPTLF